MTDLTSKYIINGPNNVVRLENGEKILYIFGDYHWNADRQRECEFNDKHDSIDIDKLLLKFMKEETKCEYDLFIEMNENDFINNINLRNNGHYKYMYILQIRKLFLTKFSFNKNQIITNKKYPNFRFHYSDIRDLLTIPTLSNFCYHTSTFLIYSFQDLKNVITDHSEILLDLKKLFKILNNNDNKNINKIKNVYNDKKIQVEINHIFKEIIENLNNIIKNTLDIINFTSVNINKIKDFESFEKIRDKVAYEIYLKINQNKDEIAYLVATLTDLYFIRRFLDKDYIKKSILYTGAAHMENILFILVKYFNFKLTNVFYSNSSHNLNNIKKLSIKNFKYSKFLTTCFRHYDKHFQATQCVNLFNFPPNFT